MGEQWLTVAAAAERVGKSEKTIYRWVHEGLLERHRPTGLVREVDLLVAEKRARQRNPASRSTPVEALAREMQCEPDALRQALRVMVETGVSRARDETVS